MQLTIQPNFFQKKSNYKNKEQNTRKIYASSQVTKSNLNEDKISFKGGSGENELINALRKNISSLKEASEAQCETIFSQGELIKAKSAFIEALENSNKKLEQLMAEQKIFMHKSLIGIKEQTEKLQKLLLLNQRTNNAKESLMDKFIKPIFLENNTPNNSIRLQNNIPSGIIISGSNKDQVSNTAEWAIYHSDSNIIPLDFKDLSKKGVLDRLDIITNELKNPSMFENIFISNPDKSVQKIPAKRTILHISNFEKFTKPTKDNELVIDKLKTLFELSSGNYKGTIIADAENIQDISPEIMNDKHFQIKIDLNK